MPDYLSKREIAEELYDELNVSTGLSKTQITRVLDGLAALAADEIANGEDFAVPGIVVLRWKYIPALAKGEKFKKGDEVIGFGGVARIADADSPPRKQSVKLQAATNTAINRLKPKKATMGSFMKTRTGKTIVERKS